MNLGFWLPFTVSFQGKNISWACFVDHYEELVEPDEVETEIDLPIASSIWIQIQAGICKVVMVFGIRKCHSNIWYFIQIKNIWKRIQQHWQLMKEGDVFSPNFHKWFPQLYLPSPCQTHLCLQRNLKKKMQLTPYVLFRRASGRQLRVWVWYTSCLLMRGLWWVFVPRNSISQRPICLLNAWRQHGLRSLVPKPYPMPRGDAPNPFLG